MLIVASMASSGEFFVSLERVKLVATVRYVSSSRGSYCRRRLRQYLCRFLSDTRRRAVERRRHRQRRVYRRHLVLAAGRFRVPSVRCDAHFAVAALPRDGDLRLLNLLQWY